MEEDEILLNNYEHWEDYFDNEYSKSYKQFLEIKKSYINKIIDDKHAIFKAIYQHFTKCMQLGQLFLYNNGLFPYGNRTTIRMLYRTSYISDGDMWMILQEILNKPKQIVDNLEDEFLFNTFCIFDDFYNIFLSKRDKNA